MGRRALFRALAEARSRLDEELHAHYIATKSILVFDHLTRGVALLHDERRRSPSPAT